MGSRLSPVRNAPKLLLGDVMDNMRLSVGNVHDIDRIFLEVFRLPIVHEPRWVYPRQAAVFSGCADGNRPALRELNGVDLPWNVFPSTVNNLISGIGGCFIVIDGLEARGVGQARAIGRPHWARNANVVLRYN